MKKDGRCYEYSDLSYGTWSINKTENQVEKGEKYGGELSFVWFVDGKDDEKAKEKSTWNYIYEPNHKYHPLSISKCKDKSLWHDQKIVTNEQFLKEIELDEQNYESLFLLLGFNFMGGDRESTSVASDKEALNFLKLKEYQEAA